jgi:hypothetical protein
MCALMQTLSGEVSPFVSLIISPFGPFAIELLQSLLGSHLRLLQMVSHHTVELVG